MQTATSGSWVARVSRIAAVVGVLLIPIATTAQRAGDSAAHYSSNTRVVGIKTGVALNTAIEFLHEKRYDDARTALGELRLDSLSPYERGKTEQILFSIANGERKYAEARRHLQNAIESGGLTQQEIIQAQRQIEQIDARLAASPVA